jgi:nitrogen fixation protein FixH
MKQKYNWWLWAPAAGIGLTALANLVALVVAKRINPERVEERPYLASARFDADKAQREAFIRAGLRLQLDTTGDRRLRLAVIAPAGTEFPTPARIAFWRPDDAALDTHLVWNHPAIPCETILPRIGSWRVRVDLTVAGVGEVSTEESVVIR